MVKWLLLLLPLFLFCENIKEQPEIIRPVRYQKIYYSGGDRSRIFSGSAKAGKESKLSFKVSGTISKILGEVGKSVRQGETIAVLDTKDFSLQLQEAKAGLEQTQAQAVNATTNYQRIRELYENNNTSLSSLESALAAKKSAEAMVESSRKRAELAELRLSYTKLTAPFDGQISAIYSEVNENTQTGAPVILLTSKDDLEVQIGIPEQLITKIHKNDTVEVRFHSIQERKFKGYINEVGVSQSQYSSTYPVTIRLEETSENMKPGMVADVSLKFAEESDKETIIIPLYSVLEDNQSRFVFLARPADSIYGVTEKVEIKTGDLTENGVEVLEGLKENDLLITAGISQLTAGMKVKLNKGME